MLITIRELRNYIRNALSPATSHREQLGTLGKAQELGTPPELIDDDDFERVEDPGKVVVNDPYVNQDVFQPTAGGRKFGRTF